MVTLTKKSAHFFSNTVLSSLQLRIFNVWEVFSLDWADVGLLQQIGYQPSNVIHLWQ